MGIDSKTSLGLALAVLLALAGCDNEDPPPTDAGVETDAAMQDAAMAIDAGGPSELRSVSLTQTGLETLTGGAHYEGWAIIDGAPVSFGKFNIDASDTVVRLDGTAYPDGILEAGRDLRDATELVITIEGPGDVDITPSDTHYLAGVLDMDAAELTVMGGTESLGVTFAGVSGTYGLATPTDGPDSNERSGVWFVDFTAPPAASLTMPTLPAGWAYEGWVVIGGTPISTGRFTQTDMADDAAPFSGAMPGPPVPGEDLLENAPTGLAFPVDLRSARVVISVEPEPDADPAPFTLKPFVADIPSDAADHTGYPIAGSDDGTPTISITLVE